MTWYEFRATLRRGYKLEWHGNQFVVVAKAASGTCPNCVNAECDAMEPLPADRGLDVDCAVAVDRAWRVRMAALEREAA